MTALTRRLRIAALGECMIELRQHPDGKLSSAFAGDTLNTATYLRRLLTTVTFDVSYITAIGDDHLSDQMIDAWTAEGIDTTQVRRLQDQLPGLYWIRTDEKGEREFFYWRGASAARLLLTDDFARRIHDHLQSGDVLYVSGISFAILSLAHREELLLLIRDLRGRGVRIAFDSNFRARLWATFEDARALQERLLPDVEIFITSHSDEAAMFGDTDIEATAARLARAGVPEWVVRGEPGQTIASDSGKVLETFVNLQQVVDTTGAGDSFDAAFLAARLLGRSVPEAVTAGHDLAAVVVRHRGAIIPRSAMPAIQA